MNPNWTYRVKNSTVVMIDIEATGPEYGRHSMTEIGVAAGTVAAGVTERFRGVLAPLSHVVESPSTCMKAMKTGVAEGRQPLLVMQELRAFWQSLGSPKSILAVAMPAAFDWPWLTWYSHRFLGENPFGFKCHCMSAEFAIRGLKFDHSTLTHDADDAAIQLAAYLKTYG